jgi:hypothetical protein
VIEWDNEGKDFEGEKNDIQTLMIHLETALSSKSTPVVQNIPVLVLTPTQNTAPIRESLVTVQPVMQTPVSNQISLNDSASNKTAVALYDYDPAEEGELSIRENDQLYVLDESDPDWWLVKHIHKSGEGLVPATYVNLQTPNSTQVVQPDPRQEQDERLRQEEDERQKEIHRQEEFRRQEDERRQQLEIQRREQQMRLEEDKKKAEAEKQRQSVPQLPNRPITSPTSVSIPQIPSRPIGTAMPQIPNRTRNTITSPPLIPDRPTATVAAPTLPNRPIAPTSRPVVEAEPKKENDSIPFLM